MLCGYCKNDISPEARYCPLCGHPLRKRMGSPEMSGGMSDETYYTMLSMLGPDIPEDHPKKRFPKAWSILEREYLEYKEGIREYIKDGYIKDKSLYNISFDEYLNKYKSDLKAYGVTEKEWEEFLRTGEWEKKR